MNMLFLAVSLTLLTAISNVNSYNILMTVHATKSHKLVFDAVAEELGKRGHQVTIFSNIEDNKVVKNVKDVYMKDCARMMKESQLNLFQGTMTDRRFLLKLPEIFRNFTTATYSSPEVQELLKNPLDSNNKPRFDVLVVDGIFNEYMLPLGYHFGIPTIYLSPSMILFTIAWRLNIPYPFSYLSTGLDDTVSPMNFTQRALNLFKAMGFTYFRHNDLHPVLEEVYQKYIPTAPSLLELEKNVSLIMINTHPSIHAPGPRMPYFIEAGCLHCKPSKPLPKDLEDFFQSSGSDGVIYFSLGSFTQGEHMPLDMREKLIAAFSKLPQKVLWKYETKLEGLPKNIKLTKWAPQQDLLAHPKLRLFITHGGGLSMFEAVYHGCPLLAFPLSADQFGNMGMAHKKGFAETLDWKTFTPEELLSKINLMLSDARYEENVHKISALLKDYSQEPTHTAAYWVEYVVRHKGAPHLKSAAEHLNFFQYFLLDVIGSILGVLLVVLFIIVYAIRKIYRLIFGRSERKQKTN